MLSNGAAGMSAKFHKPGVSACRTPVESASALETFCSSGGAPLSAKRDPEQFGAFMRVKFAKIGAALNTPPLTMFVSSVRPQACYRDGDGDTGHQQ
jgi:hypothetical protein